MSTVYLTQAISTVYMVHPDELPEEDEQLVKNALISKTDVKELTDANGQEWYLLENEGIKDLLNHQKVPIGLIKKEDAQVVSAHNWAAFGFKTKDIAANKFVFQDAENPLFKEICKELNGDDNSKHAPKPDIPGVARLLHDPENHFKLSRWVYKHASEWAGEDSYKAEVKDFLEKNAKDTDEAKEMARRKYDRLEAKIANLAWWKEVSKKVKDFPSSPVVYHFNPTAFLEQMKRVEGHMLSRYLSYDQVVYSETAEKYGIDNHPTESHLKNLCYLGINIYDPLFDHFGDKLIITSVYRSANLNSYIKGSETSQHLRGQAIDLKVSSPFSTKDLFKHIVENLEFDQIIWEYGSNIAPQWVHVSIKESGNRYKKTQAISGKGYVDFVLEL